MIYVIEHFDGESWKDLCYTYDRGSAYHITQIIRYTYEWLSVTRQYETYAEKRRIPYCEKFLREKGIVLQ